MSVLVAKQVILLLSMGISAVITYILSVPAILVEKVVYSLIFKEELGSCKWSGCQGLEQSLWSNLVTLAILAVAFFVIWFKSYILLKDQLS